MTNLQVAFVCSAIMIAGNSVPAQFLGFLLWLGSLVFYVITGTP